MKCILHYMNMLMVRPYALGVFSFSKWSFYQPIYEHLWIPPQSSKYTNSVIPYLISTSVCESCYLKMGIDATQTKFSLWLFHIATIQYFSSWQDKWNRNSSLKTFPFYKHEFVYLFSRNPQNIRKVLPLRLYPSKTFD